MIIARSVVTLGGRTNLACAREEVVAVGSIALVQGEVLRLWVIDCPGGVCNVTTCGSSLCP